MSPFRLMSMLFLVTAFSGTLCAQGNPGDEGMCAVLKDGTPGLYGLCVAYCELQDCDVIDSDSSSCTKMLENYNKKIDVGVDPAMPCLQPDQASCPCFTEEEVWRVTERGLWPMVELPGFSDTYPDIILANYVYFPGTNYDYATITLKGGELLSTKVIMEVGASSDNDDFCHYSDSSYLGYAFEEQIERWAEFPPDDGYTPQISACLDLMKPYIDRVNEVRGQ